MLNIILRGGRLTKYKGKAASFAPGLGISSPDITTGPTFAPVLERMASALGTSVSARALATRALAVAFATAAPLAMTVTGANAGVCTETFAGSGVFVCSGPAAGGDVTQTLAAPAGGALDVSTLPGFGITTAAGDGFNLTNNAAGATNITFTDNNTSIITGGSGDGIDSRNYGTGFTSITTTGAVTGAGGNGILAYNQNTATSLTINAQGTVTGSNNGIFTNQDGSGALSITTQAVTGTTGDGIYANNSAAGTSLTINAQGTVTGSPYGIFANQDGSGALSITTQAVTGANSTGIYADNSVNGTSLTINAQGAVAGNNTGVFARNYGSGALSVTTQAVTGTNAYGILAVNNTAGTSLTINAQGAVTGGVQGVYAGNNGTGAVSVTTQAVTAGLVGLFVQNVNVASTSPITINAQGAVYGGAFGIFAANNGTGAITINNTGGITGGTTGVVIDVRTNNSPATINNSAAITGTGGVAINFRGNGNDTLNLLGGSAITGTIDFGNGNANDVDTLNAAPGVNTVLTFADAGGAGQGDTDLLSAPENTSSNIALITGGTQAVAVDPTGFAASAAAVGGLTTGIFNLIDNTGSGPLGDTPLSGGITPAGGDAKSLAYGSNRRLWVSGFGGRQKVDGSSSQAGIKDNFGGVITGVESNLGDKSSYGVFGGYAKSKIDIEFGAGDVDTRSVFGGAYWKMDMGTYRVQLALVAGSADQDTTRNVDGVNARGETDGWFFSPSATLTAPIEGLSFPLIASGRVSYAALFLDGYTETGVANPLTVGDRDVGVFSTRAQLTLPQVFDNKDGSTTRIDWRAGIDAQFDVGSDNVSLTVGGTPLSFSADLDNQAAGFIGSTVTYTSQNGLYSLSASGEIQSTFGGGYKAVGQLRGIVNF